jgi:hypothetical protein
MECRDVKKRLGAYHDGECEDLLRKKIEAHLKECNGCLKEYQDLKKTLEFVDSWQVRLPERDLLPAIKERLRPTRPRVTRILRLALPSLAAAGVLVGILIHLVDRYSQEVIKKEPSERAIEVAKFDIKEPFARGMYYLKLSREETKEARGKKMEPRIGVLQEKLSEELEVDAVQDRLRTRRAAPATEALPLKIPKGVELKSKAKAEMQYRLKKVRLFEEGNVVCFSFSSNKGDFSIFKKRDGRSKKRIATIIDKEGTGKLISLGKGDELLTFVSEELSWQDMERIAKDCDLLLKLAVKTAGR